ncbi:MAG TPA: Hsp70 family protein, partial [Cytophagaceae bacterium]|nr:Hsp70 family protein [Cytophagaceae bacterium]
MAKHIYGIDFGTSNSVLVALNTSTREIVKVNSQSSLIYFQDAQNIFIGNQAIEKYISNNMKGRLLKSIKTLLPQSAFTFTYIFGKKYAAEDLVCLILEYLKSEADQYFGEEVTELVLGRPVVFSEDEECDKLAEKRLLMAAKKAGFKKIWFQYEPIAAGFLYEHSLDEPEMVLIGDFGGGTSDFTLMQLDKNKIHLKERRGDILKTGGVHIGGDDFDAEIMWNKFTPYFGYGLKYDSYGKMLDLPVHIFRTICEWEQMAFLKEGKIRKQLDNYYQYTNKNPALQRLMSLIDNNLGFSLFQAIERSKINLSGKEKSHINFSQANIDIQEKLDLPEFNEFIREEIKKIDDFLSKFLEDAGIESNKIDHVFITGGTSCSAAVM